MRFLLIFLALISLCTGHVAASLDPQADPDVIYSDGSAGTFIAGLQRNNVYAMPILDLTGLGSQAIKIYSIPVMRNDGDVNRSHYKDISGPFWYPDLTVPV